MYRLPGTRMSQNVRSRDYCTFKAHDWRSLGIEISRIGDGVDLKHSQVGTACAFSRAVILGRTSKDGIAFDQSDKIHVLNPAIERDYADELARCLHLRSLLRLLQAVRLTKFLQNVDSQFLVEIIDRRFENTEGIPPHTDGTSCLFFVILGTTMIGGSLSLYSASNLDPGGVMRDGTRWYRKDEATILAQLPCMEGNGYLIAEDHRARASTIYHGCAPWRFGTGSLNQRKSLRIAFYSRYTHLRSDRR